MDTSLVIDNLLSPAVVAFVVALLASLLWFETRLPEQLPPILSAYLLFAIGLKGGRSLGATDPVALLGPVLGTVLVGAATAAVAFLVMQAAVGLGRDDAAGLAAHYGSVSAVTFVVVLATVESRGLEVEGYLAGLLAVLEVVGIVAGLAFASGAGRRTSWSAALAEIVRGRSVTLLLLGLVVGALAGDARLAAVDPLFVGLFNGALVLFLLEMGSIAAERLREVAQVGPRLVLAALIVPLVNGAIGASIGSLVGLSTGGTAVLATLAASASYIAAPAAVRIALPSANPSLSITAALGITFPFNLVVGIPIYLWFATLMT
jgi:hypothetical protein